MGDGGTILIPRSPHGEILRLYLTNMKYYELVWVEKYEQNMNINV
jgi:hypothetical protein